MAAVSLSKNIQEDVSSLKQDMAKVGLLVDRLDVAIDKLTEVSTTVSQLLAVHETKITAHDIVIAQTTELVEKRRMETEEKVQLLHARISSGEKELSEKIDNQYDSIMNELKEMRRESTEQHNKLSGRITVLEKWMWIAIGGSVVIGVIINNLKLLIPLITN